MVQTAANLRANNPVEGPTIDAIVADAVANAADTYLLGIQLGGRLKVGSIIRFRGRMSKTAAGTAAPAWHVRVGAAGAVADTARVSVNGAAQTAVADEGVFEVVVTVRAIGAAAVLQAMFYLGHRLASSGLTSSASQSLAGVSAAFDASGADLHVGISVNPGAAGVWTFQSCTVEALNLAATEP